MTKKTKIIVTCVLIAIFIGAIGSIIEDNKTDEPVKEVETKTEAQEYEAPVKTDEELQIEKDDDYLLDVSLIADDISYNLRQFGMMFEDASVNPNLLYDEDWIMETGIIIATLDANLDKGLALEPTDKTKEIDQSFKKALNYYKSIPEKVPNAVDNMDVNLLESVVIDVEKGNDEIEKTTNLVFEYWE